jgi:DNA invertase Pin-like site-specific DNA recombinase
MSVFEMNKLIDNALNPKKVLRIAYYIRVSTAEQVSKENSLPAQKLALDAWCEKNGAKCVGVYADEGKTAAKQIRKRKEIHRLLQDIRDDKIDLVIFTRFDRFTRNPEEYFKVMETFNEKGIQWKAINQPELDLNTDMGQTLILFYLGMGRQEIANISERIKATAAVRIQKGSPITGAHNMPISHTIGTDDRGNKIVIRDPEKEPLVWAYIDHYEQHHSKRAATFYVNELFGVDHHYGVYDKMMKNTMMYGHYKGTDGYCEPYVTEERWKSWQELNKKNIWHRSSDENAVYIFSQLCVCGSCGRRLSGTKTNPRGTRYYYYRCNSAIMSGQCDQSGTTSEIKIEKYLLAQIKPEIEKYIAEYELSIAQPAQRPKVDRVKKLEQELERVNYQFQKNRISLEKYDEQYEDLVKRIAEARAEEEAAEKPPEPKDLEPLREFLKMDILSIYPDLSREEKRILWRSVIEKIVVSPDGKLTVKFL